MFWKFHSRCLHITVRGLTIVMKEFISNLSPDPTFVRVIKSRRLMWAGRVARMGRGEVCTEF